MQCSLQRLQWRVLPASSSFWGLQASLGLWAPPSHLRLHLVSPLCLCLGEGRSLALMVLPQWTWGWWWRLGCSSPRISSDRCSLSVDKSPLTPLSSLETQEPTAWGTSGTRTHPREFLRSRDQAWRLRGGGSWSLYDAPRGLGCLVPRRALDSANYHLGSPAPPW